MASDSRPRRPRRRRHGNSDRQAVALDRVRGTASVDHIADPARRRHHNQKHLTDPLYIGWQHERVRGAEDDDFIESSSRLCTNAGPRPAALGGFRAWQRQPAVARYRDRLCTFNDDIQGTAAIAIGTLLSAIGVTGVPLTEQRIAVLGAGSAGTGVCALLLRAMIDAGLSEAEARSRFYLVDRQGCWSKAWRTTILSSVVRASPRPGGQLDAGIARLDRPRRCRRQCPSDRADRNVRPAGRALAIHRANMAEHVRRPVILILSNPTERAEATPQDLDAWTEGRAIIGSGSPFPPLKRNGKDFRVDQTNNAYVYPGIGLGAMSPTRGAFPIQCSSLPREPSPRFPRRARPGCKLAAATRRNSPALVPCRACGGEAGPGRGPRRGALAGSGGGDAGER